MFLMPSHRFIQTLHLIPYIHSLNLTPVPFKRPIEFIPSYYSRIYEHILAEIHQVLHDLMFRLLSCLQKDLLSSSGETDGVWEWVVGVVHFTVESV